MTLIAFPPLEPLAGEAGRELKLGKFPNKRYNAPQGGSSSVRGFGSISSGQQLTISFGVVTDQEIAEVWLAWDAACGKFRPLALPDLFFFGIKAELLAKVPSTINWHFSPEMPNYESAGPGYSQLDPITFVGELGVQFPGGIWVPVGPPIPIFQVPEWFEIWLSQTTYGVPGGSTAPEALPFLFNIYGNNLLEECTLDGTSGFLTNLS